MALYIFEKHFLDDHIYITNTLRILAKNYTSVQDYPDAIRIYKKLLAIQKNDPQFVLLRGLAEIYGRIDSLQQADEYFKLCLQYTIKATGEDSYQASVSYHSYGQFLLEKMHEYSLGEQYLSKSIRIKYRIFNEAAKDIVNTLNILGTYYINSGQIERGLDSLQSSIIIVIKGFNNRDIYVNPDIKDFARQVSIPNTLAWKAYGLYLRYLQTNNLADLKASFRTYDKFALLAKEIRKYYQNSENMITSQEIYYVFEQAVDIGHMLYEKTGDSIYLDKIFTLIESKKSYTLFNSLNILEKKRLLQVPKTLLNTESNLQQQLGLINEKIDEEKSYRNNDSILRIFNKEAFKISMSLDSIRKIYKAKYSGFYQLKYGFKDMSLKEIQSKIPTNQAFLNYLVSDSLLSIMCITKNEVHLRCQQIDSSFFNPLRELIRLQKKVNTDNAYLEFHHFIKDSRLLYQYLIAPFDSVIKDKELVIIPDNILSYISFDALLTKDVDVRRPDYSRLPYLIKEHRTNVTNSMEIYFNMKARPKSKNQEIYAFAPSYPNTKDTAGLPKEYKFLRPLEYSNEEVRSIQQHFPTKLFLNEAAKKDSFSIEAKHAKIIHLAMHTIIDNQKPMYSKLLFTYDSAVKNGVVNTYELLNMNLNADLAVLSGCSTGDGELQKGEGVMSLSTGFQYAGVPAIVMSLWEVNDKYGSLVIDDFYKYLARGLPKNQSLHQAKLDVLSNGNALYAHPFYWAGLTLMGDDSKIEFKEEKTSNYDLLYLPGIAILISLAWWYKRKKAA
jgi:CHAT domain-containing protein